MVSQAKKAAHQAAAAAAAKGHDGVLPGSVKSPIPPLKLPGQKKVNVAGLNIGSVNVPQLRAFLRAKGYDIPKTGNSIGPEMKSALADFLNPKTMGSGPLAQVLKNTRITGARDPQAWNQKYGGPTTKAQAYKPTSQLLDNNGNDPVSSTSGTVDLRSLGKIAAQVGVPIPQSLADKLAEDTAGEKYDPQIHDVQTLIADQPQQAAQNQHDIATWFGQVQNALKTATGRDAAMTKSGVGSLRDAVAQIVSSLGGSANQGSGEVGAEGADAVGTLQALGNSQDMLNNDLASLYQNEEAGAHQQQSAKDAQVAQQLQQQLEDLQGARGQLKGATDASTLLTILDDNNKLAQQTFANKLALQQAGEAAQLNGMKALYYGSKANSAPGSFAGASTTSLQNAANAIAAHVVDANGKPLPGMTPQKAAAIGATVAGVYFPGGGVPTSWVQSVVSPFFQGS